MLGVMAVVFGGIVSNGAPEATRISNELVAVVRERVEITPITLPAPKLASLTHHASGSAEIVADLHVDGLIGGELIDHAGKLTLRLVVYAADGHLRSLTEITLRNRALGFGDFASIRSNLGDEIVALVKVAPKPAPKPVAAEIEMEIEPEPTPAATVDVAAVEDEQPAALTEAVGVTATAEPDDPDPVLGLRVGLGLGVSARSFQPGPATVAGYSASPVGTLGVAARIQPARKLCLDALVERTISMSTAMATSNAETSMSRWEVSADYQLATGRVALATRVGLGRRAFAIQSNESGRTPDSDYNYMILGATAVVGIGHGVALLGTAAFEPVLWGTEPTEMAFGEARRWALDVGGAVELHPTAHVFVRVAADVQRFAWTWTSAGDRGSGGAVDLFPSAMGSVGATY